MVPGRDRPGPEWFSTQEAADELDVSYRQIDLWDRKNVLRPQVRAIGSGSRRWYSPGNVRVLRVLVEVSRVTHDYRILRGVAGFLGGLDPWLWPPHLIVGADGKPFESVPPEERTLVGVTITLHRFAEREEGL